MISYLLELISSSQLTDNSQKPKISPVFRLAAEYSRSIGDSEGWRLFSRPDYISTDPRISFWNFQKIEWKAYRQDDIETNTFWSSKQGSEEKSIITFLFSFFLRGEKLLFFPLFSKISKTLFSFLSFHLEVYFSLFSFLSFPGAKDYFSFHFSSFSDKRREK